MPGSYLALLLVAVPCFADSTFQSTVQPFVAKNCVGCHNDKLQSGGLNLKAATDVAKSRDDWEHVVEKLKAGEMPPKGMPRPAPQQVALVTKWLEDEFAREDAAIKPDPGRVTARRLNRYEYNTTIRDLLAVDFRPADDFPTDDFGYGFDNIGDVLTLSPTLMEKYLAAARKVARLAVEGEPAPKMALKDRHCEHRPETRRVHVGTQVQLGWRLRDPRGSGDQISRRVVLLLRWRARPESEGDSRALSFRGASMIIRCT